MEDIHHTDRWSTAAGRKATCGSSSAFGDDLVSQSFIRALLTYGDHKRQTDILLPEMNTVHYVPELFSQRNEGGLLWAVMFNAEAVSPLASEVFLMRVPVNN